MGNYALGVALALLALAFLAVFVVVTLRIFKALITTVWSGREGLNPLNAQGRLRLFGIVCLVAASALLIVGMERGLDVLVLIIAAGALVFSGVHLFQRAKRFDAPSGIKVLSED